MEHSPPGANNKAMSPTTDTDVISTSPPVPHDGTNPSGVELRSLGPPVVVNMATMAVGSIIIDWPELKKKLQDEASSSGWVMASKMQQRPGQNPGWSGHIYCSHHGCNWRVDISKMRGYEWSKVTSVATDHNHNFKVVIDLPKEHTFDGSCSV